MKSKLIYCLIFLFLSTMAFANVVPKDPILTPIKGLTINSHPGQMSLTNNTGKDIFVSKMLLTFSLDQNNVASLWGNPWLNWMKAPTSKMPREIKAYQFTNQAYLSNNTLRAGDTITVNYNPEPWNNPNAPKDIQLYSLVYPLNPAVISFTTTSQGGTNTITIINKSDKTISLDGAQLRMDYNGKIASSIWGSPWGNWTIGQSGPNYVLNAGTVTEIPVNGTLTISFNGDIQPISNVQLWTQQSQTPTTQGEVDVAFPATPAGVTVNPQVTLTGPSFPAGTTLIGTWGQTLVQKNLQAGSYTLQAPEISSSGQIYVASFTPNPAIVVSAQPVAVTASYSAKQLGQLRIQLSAAPALGLAAPQLKITGPEFPTGVDIISRWNEEFAVCPGGASSCSGIKEGNYTLSAPTIYSTTDAYKTTIVNPILVKLNEVTQVPLAYQAVPKGTFTTTINVPSVRKKISEQEFQVNFTNAAGFAFPKTLKAGANQVSLPINDTYAISAPTLPGLVASITPSSITVNQSSTPPVVIDYKQGSTSKLVVYYGGWEGMLYNLNNLPTTVSCVNLSFANITSNYQVDTVVSGSFTNIPATNSRMQPTYINWTAFKYNRPTTKIVMAVGGATFSAIWNSILTPASADTIAKNIADVVNRPYPVYRGEFAYAAELLGNVSIDGVDLDVETGGRLSPQVANNVILLTQSLKKYLNPGKIITLAGFSVGADPNDSRCTVPGSAHCGEDIPLLQSLGSTFEWVNVMAYDAGQEYANSKYQIALANYASYIGKPKTLLGLDVQSQWPGFSETASQLATKAAWQKQNGYGGAMFWGVGVENNPSKEQQYIDAIAAGMR